MKYLFTDFESASDVNLKKHGLMRYARHPSTRVLMLGWAFDDEPVQLWEPHLTPEMPARLRAALEDPGVIKVAHNSFFELAIFHFVLKILTPIDQWRCTMVAAYELSLPGSLHDLGNVVGLPEGEKKLKSGATLIRRFCMPREPTANKPWTWSTPYNEPEDWKLFCEYCVQDVATERTLFRKLSKFHIPESEWALWAYDHEINTRGLPVDVEFCQAALDVAKAEKARLIEEMRGLTGLRNPGSVAQLLPWLRERGYPFASLKKERVAKALEDFDNWGQQPKPTPEQWDLAATGAFEDEKKRTPAQIAAMQIVERHTAFRPLDEEAKVVLRLHQQANRSSWKKYQTILDWEFEGRLYYQFQFAGAGRTARWAGRGVQPQNFPRPMKAHVIEVRKGEEILDPALRQMILDRDIDGLRIFYGDVMACLKSAIRSAIKAPPGRVLVVSDLSSIESRALGWLARCEALLQVFRDGLCAYKSFATRLFNKPYDQITKAERQDTKPAVLGCGYRLGPGAEIGEYPDTVKVGLLGYAESMGIKLTRPFCVEAVSVFRDSYVEVVEFWYDLENAAMKTVLTQQPTAVGPLQFDIKAPFLRMRLPSGRFVHYLRPRVQMVKSTMPDGTEMTKRQVTYEGMSNITKKWGRMSTHGGRFCEQADQAFSRDILAYGLMGARERLIELAVCGSTHDEIIAERDEVGLLDDHDLSDVMSVVPPWAQGLPLAAEGYTSAIYRK